MLKLVHIDSVNDDIILSPQRLQRLSVIKNPDAVKLSKAAEQAYNEASMEYRKKIVPYWYEKNGKPYNDEFFFSLSHSGEYAVCAASDRPVGVDIQCMRRFDTGICKRFFTKEECEFVSAEHADAFFEIWVKKEAYAKMTGQGIVSFPKFSVFGLSECEFKMHPAPSGYLICTCTAGIPKERKHRI